MLNVLNNCRPTCAFSRLAPLAAEARAVSPLGYQGNNEFMSKEKKKAVETWISVVTAAVSIIALFFSWQANRIATQQSTAQIVILDTSWNGGGYRQIDNRMKATCKHIVRITNLGGVATAISSYRVNISLGKKALSFESSFPIIVKPDDISSQLGDFEILLMSRDTLVDFPDISNPEGILSLPFKLEPHTTYDIQVAISFYYDGNLYLESAKYNEPDSYYYAPKILEGFTPIQVVYTFITASGQTASSSQVACWYVK